MRKITDLYPDHNIVRLGIGEGGVFDKPTVVTTVLGSCVSVAFHCRSKGIGAIFHALLPTVPDEDRNKPITDFYKYVDSSIRYILNSFSRRGVKLSQIEAKVFGGADGTFKGVIQPGADNVMKAYEILTAHNIKIVASDVGGNMGRNLVFVSSSGKVFIKTHQNNISEALLEKYNKGKVDHFHVAGI